MKPSNLLLKPTVLIIWVAILPLAHKAVDSYLADKKVSPSLWAEIVFTVVGALTATITRYYENDQQAEPLYTPDWMLGANKQELELPTFNSGMEDGEDPFEIK